MRTQFFFPNLLAVPSSQGKDRITVVLFASFLDKSLEALDWFIITRISVSRFGL
jgi:hypothetical protein